MNEVVRNPRSKLIISGVTTCGPEVLQWVFKCITHYRVCWEAHRKEGSYHGVIYSRWENGSQSHQLYIYITKTSIVVRYSLKE